MLKKLLEIECKQGILMQILMLLCCDSNDPEISALQGFIFLMCATIDSRIWTLPPRGDKNAMQIEAIE